MVIDTSVLVAIVLGESTAAALQRALRQAESRDLSAVSLLEAGIVLRTRMRAESTEILDSLIQEIDCQVVPFDEVQARTAVTAHQRYGKGQGHRAQLNFGDCAVYALAALRGEPVLAIGNDFRATDLTVVPL